LIQLLQIHNGLAVFAVMTIYSILIFCKAVLQVVVGYCLAFLSLAVMISLAPFFITFLLFERTKSMFDNWLSTMFNYMMQPTILLIFILLIDQVIGEIIIKTIVMACWGSVTPIDVGLDLDHVSIPFSRSFKIPFLTEISFYVPELKEVVTMQEFFFEPATFPMLITSSFLFFALCKLADGLSTYVGLLVPMLTNVQTGKGKGGKESGIMSQVDDITNNLSSVTRPVTGALKSAGVSAVRTGAGAVSKGISQGKGFIKSKFIDQKISDKGSSKDRGEISYNKIKKVETSSDQLKTGTQDDGKLISKTGGEEIIKGGLTQKPKGFKDVTNEKTDVKSKLEKLKNKDIKDDNKSGTGVNRQGLQNNENLTQSSSKEGNDDSFQRQDFTQSKSGEDFNDLSSNFDNSSKSDGGEGSFVTRSDLDRSTTENDQSDSQNNELLEKQTTSNDTKEPDVSPKKEDARVERKSSTKLKGDDE
jgi:hypothetical protein